MHLLLSSVPKVQFIDYKLILGVVYKMTSRRKLVEIIGH